jgi:DNA-binding response OmpR family regulator
MAKEPIAKQSVLAVLPFGEDRTVLKQILGHSIWEVRFTATFDEARNALHTFSFGVVISEGRLPDGLGWKDLLREIQDVAASPPLIVVDRLADELLWAEVLNLGGYDVLVKPFEIKEVLHAVTVACDFCENERRMSVLRKSAKSTRESLFEKATRTASAGD